MKTILVALAHPDDEVGCAGTMATHAARGDRVVALFLTRGEMTEALGTSDPAEVAELRMEHGRQAAAIVGAEAHFLDLPDTRVRDTPEAAARVARVVADVRPDAVLTWGDAWIRGMRHPDHQATGRLVRTAVTLARMARAVAPAEPHRGAAPIFTLRDRHSNLPAAAIDVSPGLEAALALGEHYRARIGWPWEGWHEARLRRAGQAWDVAAAEVLDAWETEPGLWQCLTDAPLVPY
jgi:LmbE family N-acetylglucosaminyl deacetylase